MRVIVTGSRSWKDGALVRQKLEDCLDTTTNTGDTLTVVHGACRSGADYYADGWARWQSKHHHPAHPEPHPARWEDPCRPTCRPGHRRHDPRGWDVCPQAGFYRNEHMVTLGADLCLAFITDQSKGATHCATYAESQGVHTLWFRVDTTADALF